MENFLTLDLLLGFSVSADNIFYYQDITGVRYHLTITKNNTKCEYLLLLLYILIYTLLVIQGYGLFTLL